MENIKYFDSHAHLHDERFESEFEGGSIGMMEACFNAGICGIVNIGTNPKDACDAVKFAEKYPFVYAAVGIYPSEAQYLGDDLDDGINTVIELQTHPKVVALGEIGLDYHYEDTDREIQKYAFEKQMQLAAKYEYPVVVHDRDAHGDVMDIIRKYPTVKGMMHSFSGSAEMARQLASLGWMISFSGPVTYKNAAKVKEAAIIVPDENILIETDSPYLPPVPHRGKLNYPVHVALTAKAIAELRGITEAEIASLTVANAKRFFRI